MNKRDKVISINLLKEKGYILATLYSAIHYYNHNFRFPQNKIFTDLIQTTIDTIEQAKNPKTTKLSVMDCTAILNSIPLYVQEKTKFSNNNKYNHNLTKFSHKLMILFWKATKQQGYQDNKVNLIMKTLQRKQN